MRASRVTSFVVQVGRLSMVAFLLLAVAGAAQDPAQDAATYAGLVDRYRSGEYAAAVTTLRAWPAEVVARVARRTLRDDSWQANPVRWKAAALLHIEVAFTCTPHERSQLEQNLRQARDCLSAVERHEPGTEFVRRGRLALGYTLRFHARHREALAYFREARLTRAGREDPEAIVAMGQVDECSAQPTWIGFAEAERKMRLARAERLFRDALRLDPDSAEARLRLAHTLSSRGDMGAAAEQLDTLLKAEPAAHIRSLAELLAGRVAEAKGDLSAACAHYTTAIRSADPLAQSAVIALAHGSYRAGEEDAAATLLLHALSRPLPRPDFWSHYCYRLPPIESVLETLREEVRP